MTGSPSPAPSETLNFDAHSMLLICAATANEPSVMRMTAIRLARTTSRAAAPGRRWRA